MQRPPTLYLPKPQPRRAEQWMGDFDAMPLEWRQNRLIELSRDGSLIVVTRNGPMRAELTDQVAEDPWKWLYPVPDALWQLSWDLMNGNN